MNLAATNGIAAANIGAGALSVACIVALVFGIKGKGRKKLTAGSGLFIGIITELCFLKAQGPWLELGNGIQSIPESLAFNPKMFIGSITGVLVILVVAALFAPLAPVTGAILGLFIGAAMQASDYVLAEVAETLFSFPLSLFGI